MKHLAAILLSLAISTGAAASEVADKVRLAIELLDLTYISGMNCYVDIAAPCREYGEDVKVSNNALNAVAAAINSASKAKRFTRSDDRMLDKLDLYIQRDLELNARLQAKSEAWGEKLEAMKAELERKPD